jgi:lipopolysaccharide biosynthesis protein
VSTGRSTEPVQGNRAENYLHAAPRVFGERLAAAVNESPIVFVDSWNDWNHGATLEPDTRLGRAYLAATRRALSRARPPDLRVAAVIHAFYPELLRDLVAMLAALPLPIARLVVTTVAPREAEARAVLEQAKLGFPHECQVHENRGRDILPFLRVANALADDAVDLVVKLHTKRSRHRADGDAWRRELSGALLSPESAGRIFAAFRSDPKLGVVGGEGHLLSTKSFFGSNEGAVRYVTRRMGFYDLDPGAVPFPAGSMFHARLAALRPLLDAHLGEWEFEPENGAIDGTMAHAVERCVGAACTGAGFHLASSAAPERPLLDGSAVYAYAPSPK